MFEFIIEKFSKLMGWFIVLFFGLAISSYIIKLINKKYGKSLRGHKHFGKYYDILVRLIIKYHKAFGFLAILFTAIHFIIFFNIKGLNVSGSIAAVLMVFIILQGSYGSFIMKKRNKSWLYIHRALSIILIFSILFHIL